MSLLEAVVVIHHTADVYETFHEDLFQRHEEAERGDARDTTVELVTEVPLHVFDLLERHTRALCLGRRLLTSAAPLCEAREGLRVLIRLSLSTYQARAHDPVHHQVRVSPNRRGKMGVPFGCESEMTHVRRFVTRLSKGPEDQCVDQYLLMATTNDVKNVLKVTRFEASSRGDLYANPRQGFRQHLHLLRRGRFVDAVHRVQAPGLQIVRNHFVGEDHVVLNEPVGLEPIATLNVDRVAFGVQNYFGLREIQIKGTPLHPPGPKGARMVIQASKGIVDSGINRTKPVKHLLSLLV